MKISVFTTVSCLASSVSALWPLPSQYTNGSSVVYLNPNVHTVYQPIGHYGKRTLETRAAGLPSDADMVNAAFGRFKDNLKSAYYPWKFYPRGAQIDPSSNGGATINTITVKTTGSRGNAKPGEVDESYSLELSKSGSVTITAVTANGALHGLTTLSQLFYTTSGGKLFTPLAPVSITDKPAFPHRALNIDISRNWEPPENIMRTIDGLALNKFNFIHIHATDAQSWPLEIPSIPELAAKGAYAPNLVWTAAQLQQVQEYAVLRGIEPVIEIDSPGHTSSIAYSHPELIVAFNEQPWGSFCNEPPCGEVYFDNSAVTSFFKRIYDDILPRVTPFTSFFHTGGDEVNSNAYGLDPKVHSNDSTVIQPFLSTFVKTLHSYVNAAGLSPIVWEEMILNWNLTLTKNTIVQTWLSSESLAQVTDKGYRALFGEYNYWYLDCGYGQWIDPNTTNPATPIVPPYADYCSPQKSWREVYAYDPTANLTSAQKDLVVGGVVSMWHELTDPVNLDGKLWPRAAAAGEVLWSGPKGVAGVDESVTRRLADQRERMVNLGFQAAVVQMTWCLQTEGSCSL